MKRLLALSAVLLWTACMDDADSPVVPDTQVADAPVPLLSLQTRTQERPVPGRLVVKVRPDESAAEVARAHGLEVAGRGYRNAFVLMRGAMGNERALAARLGNDARVEWAEPDYLRQPHAIDSRLWAFENPGGLTVDYTRGRNKGSPVTSYASLEDADVDNLDGIASGGAAVLVGSIDTGVDFAHTEFSGVTLVAGSDWYDGDADPSDSDGHGTHTTGTMVGNTVGIAGVAGASSVGVYVQRVCGPLGCPLSAIANAIMEAADAGVVAMNLSLGGSSLSDGEAEAIDYAIGKGALVIASAGNGGTGTVSCPACDPDAISVGATNWQDDQAYYTNWGPGLDLVAPGGELYSNTTDEAGIWSSVPGGYAYFQGTSMAAPHVTGVAGIVASANGLEGSTLRSALETTADDLGAGGYDQEFGNGRVNAMAALGSEGGDGGGGGGGGEEPPATVSASISYSCSKPDCTFDGTASTGDNLSYAWTIGAETVGSDPVLSWTFEVAGSHTVELTVSNADATDSDVVTVSCVQRGPNLHCG